MPEVVFRCAEHVGPEFDEVRRHAVDAVLGERALHHVAHYSDGVFDFALDAFTDEVLATMPRVHDEALRLGRQLTFAANAFDRDLETARTDRLIRLVAQTATGAACCMSVVPRQLVVGLCVEDAAAAGEPGTLLPMISSVRATDQAVASLASVLRDRLHLYSQNWGGWGTAHDTEHLHTGHGTPKQLLRAPDAPAAHRIATACADAVGSENLHLAAYYAGDELVAAADVLDDPRLRPFFTNITPETRRRFYFSFGRELSSTVRRLSRILTPVLGGRLLRLVLDVEQGAIYYYRLSPGRYLVGVTLIQSSVDHADLRMAQLATDCGPHEG